MILRLKYFNGIRLGNLQLDEEGGRTGAKLTVRPYSVAGPATPQKGNARWLSPLPLGRWHNDVRLGHYASVSLFLRLGDYPILRLLLPMVLSHSGTLFKPTRKDWH